MTREQLVAEMVAELDKNPEIGIDWMIQKYHLNIHYCKGVIQSARKVIRNRVPKLDWEETVEVPEHHRFLPQYIYSDFERGVETVGTYKSKV
jgi:hypothetical protein